MFCFGLSPETALKQGNQNIAIVAPSMEAQCWARCRQSKTNTKEQTLPIAELLPEGLSEAAISEIATLVNNVITEQVDEKVQELESKVKGFIRNKNLSNVFTFFNNFDDF